ncbi:hypothetical protein Q4574_12890 [Aliiglaciecola sp. 3_MG-2023]|uniref:YkvI family membrane protein n=1 Tax=Aliiglaciecola sp. 3_MG-2023 TaxID=3062644 RepID=UPI0026E334ED|nr:hypothetical protein [Aliiglaciecola sp. 3_MG-2023]MDO6694182.1 hypothetical protein [Aliiglaciecola sp. 3_MG-2023]
MQTSFFQRVLLPGFILQSVLIGGGYATGRELVQFFLSSGALGGFLGILVATAAFSVISMLSFEFARQTQSYTYRRFFKKLLGRAWFVYELAYFALGILVLAVIGSAAGEVVSEHLSISSTLGTVVLMASICILVAWGTKLIEKVLAGWSFLLYLVYGVFVYLYLHEYGENVYEQLFYGEIKDNWFIGAIQYVGYNIAALPLILFCVRHMRTSQDALLAGAIAGPLAMLPALFFFVAMVVNAAQVTEAKVPSDFMMQQLGVPWLQAIFYVVLFGTFIETGTAFIHGMNERIAEVYKENQQKMPKLMRPTIAAIALILSIYLASSVGLVALIGSGYGTLTWVFVAVFVLPIVSLGSFRIFRRT